jgi:hypothetical protein
MNPTAASIIAAAEASKGKTPAEVLRDVRAAVPNARTKIELETWADARARVEAVQRLGRPVETFATIANFVEGEIPRHMTNLTRDLEGARSGTLNQSDVVRLATKVGEVERDLLPRLRALQEKTGTPGLDYFRRPVGEAVSMAEAFVREGRERVAREAPPPPPAPAPALAAPASPAAASEKPLDQMSPEERVAYAKQATAPMARQLVQRGIARDPVRREQLIRDTMRTYGIDYRSAWGLFFEGEPQ